jgi:hypothetical protein
MARIEWVKQRLENWALWKERERSGGLGFSTQSVLLSDPVDRGREMPLPVLEIEAEQTNQAVESLKLGRGHLYVTLQYIYIKGVGVKEAARRMSRAESTIKANLEQADHAIRLWFDAQAEIAARKKAATADAKRSLST